MLRFRSLQTVSAGHRTIAGLSMNAWEYFPSSVHVTQAADRFLMSKDGGGQLAVQQQQQQPHPQEPDVRSLQLLVCPPFIVDGTAKHMPPAFAEVVTAEADRVVAEVSLRCRLARKNRVSMATAPVQVLRGDDPVAIARAMLTPLDRQVVGCLALMRARRVDDPVVWASMIEYLTWRLGDVRRYSVRKAKHGSNTVAGDLRAAATVEKLVLLEHALAEAELLPAMIAPLEDAAAAAVLNLQAQCPILPRPSTAPAGTASNRTLLRPSEHACGALFTVAIRAFASIKAMRGEWTLRVLDGLLQPLKRRVDANRRVGATVLLSELDIVTGRGELAALGLVRDFVPTHLIQCLSLVAPGWTCPAAVESLLLQHVIAGDRDSSTNTTRGSAATMHDAAIPAQQHHRGGMRRRRYTADEPPQQRPDAAEVRKLARGTEVDSVPLAVRESEAAQRQGLHRALSRATVDRLQPFIVAAGSPTALVTATSERVLQRTAHSVEGGLALLGVLRMAAEEASNTRFGAKRDVVPALAAWLRVATDQLVAGALDDAVVRSGPRPQPKHGSGRKATKSKKTRVEDAFEQRTAAIRRAFARQLLAAAAGSANQRTALQRGPVAAALVLVTLVLEAARLAPPTTVLADQLAQTATRCVQYARQTAAWDPTTAVALLRLVAEHPAMPALFAASDSANPPSRSPSPSFEGQEQTKRPKRSSAQWGARVDSKTMVLSGAPSNDVRKNAALAESVRKEQLAGIACHVYGKLVARSTADAVVHGTVGVVDGDTSITDAVALLGALVQLHRTMQPGVSSASLPKALESHWQNALRPLLTLLSKDPGTLIGAGVLRDAAGCRQLLQSIAYVLPRLPAGTAAARHAQGVLDDLVTAFLSPVVSQAHPVSRLKKQKTKPIRNNTRQKTNGKASSKRRPALFFTVADAHMLVQEAADAGSSIARRQLAQRSVPVSTNTKTKAKTNMKKPRSAALTSSCAPPRTKSALELDDQLAALRSLPPAGGGGLSGPTPEAEQHAQDTIEALRSEEIVRQREGGAAEDRQLDVAEALLRVGYRRLPVVGPLLLHPAEAAVASPSLPTAQRLWAVLAMLFEAGGRSPSPPWKDQEKLLGLAAGALVAGRGALTRDPTAARLVELARHIGLVVAAAKTSNSQPATGGAVLESCQRAIRPLVAACIAKVRGMSPAEAVTMLLAVTRCRIDHASLGPALLARLSEAKQGGGVSIETLRAVLELSDEARAAGMPSLEEAALRVGKSIIASVVQSASRHGLHLATPAALSQLVEALALLTPGDRACHAVCEAVAKRRSEMTPSGLGRALRLAGQMPTPPAEWPVLASHALSVAAQPLTAPDDAVQILHYAHDGGLRDAVAFQQVEEHLRATINHLSGSGIARLMDFTFRAHRGDSSVAAVAAVERVGTAALAGVPGATSSGSTAPHRGSGPPPTDGLLLRQMTAAEAHMVLSSMFAMRMRNRAAFDALCTLLLANVEALSLQQLRTLCVIVTKGYAPPKERTAWENPRARPLADAVQTHLLPPSPRQTSDDDGSTAARRAPLSSSSMDVVVHGALGRGSSRLDGNTAPPVLWFFAKHRFTTDERDRAVLATCIAAVRRHRAYISSRAALSVQVWEAFNLLLRANPSDIHPGDDGACTPQEEEEAVELGVVAVVVEDEADSPKTASGAVLEFVVDVPGDLYGYFQKLSATWAPPTSSVASSALRPPSSPSSLPPSSRWTNAAATRGDVHDGGVAPTTTANPAIRGDGGETGEGRPPSSTRPATATLGLQRGESSSRGWAPLPPSSAQTRWS